MWAWGSRGGRGLRSVRGTEALEPPVLAHNEGPPLAFGGSPSVHFSFGGWNLATRCQAVHSCSGKRPGVRPLGQMDGIFIHTKPHSIY